MAGENKSRNKGLVIAGVILMLTLIADAIFVYHKAYSWWHGLVGFDVIYGFFGCLLLIGMAKGLGALMLQQKENYYGGGEDSDV